MIARASRRAVMFVLAVVLVAIGWEIYKALGPADGGDVFGARVIPKTNDRAMPHTWDMVTRLFENESSAADSRPLWWAVAGYAWYTLCLSLGGLVLGTFVGGLIVVLNARTILVAMGAPGPLRLVLLVALGVASGVLVWRSWMVAREEAALTALIPADDEQQVPAAPAG